MIWTVPMLSAAAIIALAGPTSAADPATFRAPICGKVSKGGIRPPSSRDMVGASEVIPHGALQRNGQPMLWALHPRLARGNNPRAGWKAMIPWGQIYAGEGAPQVRNIRIAVRNLRLFVRPNATGEWCQVIGGKAISGAFFWEDFHDDASVKGNQRVELGGGISFVPIEGRNFHFFWRQRQPIPADGVSGVYSEFEARVEQDDPSGPDDRSNALLAGSAGVDYWIGLSAATGHVGINNEDAGIGRFKRLTPQWRLFTMSTAVGD